MQHSLSTEDFTLKIEGLKVKYPNLSDKINDAYSVGLNKRQLLLIIKYPMFIDEWDPSNIVSIGTVSYGSSGRKYKWLCIKLLPHPEYSCSLYNRLRGTGCSICQKELSKSNGYKTAEIGEKTERYTVDLFKSMFPKVENIGHTKDICDILVDIGDGISRTVQVKTLSEPRGVLLYSHMDAVRPNKTKYPANMLMVGININRNFYTAFLAGDVTVNAVDFNFNRGGKSKYNKYRFTDIQDFKRELLRLVPLTGNYYDIVNPVSSSTHMLENKMRNNLRVVCTEKGFMYRDNTTDYDEVDCFINDLAVQLKYTTFLQSNTALIHAEVRG